MGKYLEMPNWQKGRKQCHGIARFGWTVSDLESRLHQGSTAPTFVGDFVVRPPCRQFFFRTDPH